MKKLRVLLQDDIEYAIKCINEEEHTHPSIKTDKQKTTFETFMHKFYNEGGMVPIKNVKMHPEWTKEYETCITTKRVNMCKSCKEKSHKGCCLEYSSSNRVMIKMVIGWHSNNSPISPHLHMWREQVWRMCHSSSKRENNE